LGSLGKLPSAARALSSPVTETSRKSLAVTVTPMFGVHELEASSI
jgi:hypothetical protein